jgi:uncharacterized protein YkwD
MSFDILMHWMLALPGLVLPGLFGPSGPSLTQTTTTQPSRVTVQSPAPAASASPSASPKSRVRRTATPTPKASATPKPSAAPAAGSGTAAKLGAAEIASEATCPGQSDVSKTAQALTCLTANARVFHGLAPVSANNALMAAAVAKDQDMLSCGYGHTACGRDFGYWIKAKGYTGRCYGENIAMGQKSPREVFVAWMNSEGHRANILNNDYRDIGVAELASSGGPLWSMELGGCRS